MRRLLYCMQSSGGSWVTWCLGRPGEITIPDLCWPVKPPAAEYVGNQDAIVKVTVTRRYTLQHAITRFKPDWVGLLIRDERAVAQSLLRRYAAGDNSGRAYLPGGPVEIDVKLEKMRRAIASKSWDEVLLYEDYRYSSPTVLLPDLIRRNWESCKWCRDNTRPQKWGIGGIHPPGMTTDKRNFLAKQLKYGNFG